ncbi:hypothetical protein SteCoe_4300 [Stentor coeruleus]|uniref:Uncharacterized protein n=1 Tax=Stentor coeruleus TaxID=5963 RepID=A0A1R2CV52_9CILI|nr:hypothetical protein SteCoe_4300 [Stentor coeruleus]
MSGKKDKSELETILYKVFMNYSVYGARYSMNYLRVQKFVSMCTDAGLISPKLTPQSLDLLFRSINNRNPNMPFQTFLEATLRLAEMQNPQGFRKNPAEVYSQLITQHFLPLAGELQSKREEVTDEMLAITDDCRLILHSVFIGFKTIYMKNFPWELKPAEDVSSSSQKGLENLLREFDIYPALITKNKLYSIWRDIVTMQELSFPPALILLPQGFQDLGQCLTLSKFILIVYLCSIFGYQDTKVQSSGPEKLLVLLERIELSRTDPMNSSNSLLPPEEVIQTIIDHEPSEASIYDVGGIEDDLISCISLDQNGADIADKYMPSLQKIFQVYCAYGDPLNFKKMKSSNMLKLLKNSGLMEETKGLVSVDSSVCKKGKEQPVITAVEIDLIFSRLTGLKKQISKSRKITASIEFRQFLKALELISKKVYPEQPVQEAFNSLLEEHILKLEAQLSEERASNSKAIQEIMEQFKAEEVIEALGLVHRSLLYYYKAYANPNLMMNFPSFIRFCKDFEIFPEIASKSKLLRVFHTLSGVSTEGLDVSMQSISRTSIDEVPELAQECIDDKLFVEALAILSADINYEDAFAGPVEKICWFVERLSQTEGPEKVLKTLGHSRSTAGDGPDMVIILKNRYPDIMDHSDKRRPTFQDLAYLVPLS